MSDHFGQLLFAANGVTRPTPQQAYESLLAVNEALRVASSDPRQHRLPITQDAPDPPPDRQLDLDPIEAYRRVWAQQPQGSPSWLDYAATLGNVAGGAIMGRGGFGAPPYSRVMEGGKPRQVYHGTPFAYREMDPKRAGTGAGGDLYGPSPGGYWTESSQVAAGYSKVASQGLGMEQRIVELEQHLKAAKELGFESVIRHYEMQLANSRQMLKEGLAPNIRVAYLDITNPVDMGSRASSSWVDGIARAYDQTNPRNSGEAIANLRAWVQRGEMLERGLMRSSSLTNSDVWDIAKRSGIPDSALHKGAQLSGYDGITHIGQSGARQWIPFRADQIIDPFQYRAGNVKR